MPTGAAPDGLLLDRRLGELGARLVGEEGHGARHFGVGQVAEAAAGGHLVLAGDGRFGQAVVAQRQASSSAVALVLPAYCG